jgi:hypothetical protein
MASFTELMRCIKVFYGAANKRATPLGKIQYILWEMPNLLVDRTHC